MQKAFVLAIFLFHGAAFGQTDFAVALQDTRTKCGGISEHLEHIKTMAGVNTAVTSVGTLAGGGATVSGVVKQKIDRASDVLGQITEWADKVNSQEITNNIVFTEDTGLRLNATEKDKLRNDVIFELARIRPTYVDFAMKDMTNGHATQEVSDAKTEIDKWSKTSGDIRTGLLAAATVTNIAGAAIAGTNRIGVDLETQVALCIASLDDLARAKTQAQISNQITVEQSTYAAGIISACGQYETVSLSDINTRGMGALVSSGVGAATGLAGTITSAVANTNNVRMAGGDKEKNLNTASNVLAGVSTVSSLSSTIFNATQISAAKRILKVAQECEEALQ